MEEAVIARSAALQTANAIYCKREASRKQSYGDTGVTELHGLSV